jgi:hypothetical protein
LTVDYLVKASKALNTPIESILRDEKKSENGSYLLQSNTLNEIVVHMENSLSHLTGEQKGKLISLIYAQALKFPENSQTLFIDAIFSTIQVINDLK